MPERIAPVIEWPTAAEARLRVAQHSADVLRGGGLVVFPTDTVYGLGADPANPRAVQRIYAVKRRPDAKAIIWLLATLRDARAWCVVDVRAEVLADRFWPGGLTLVLPRLNPARGELSTLGVRVPAHPAALAIISAFGAAVATTSANRSGEPSPKSADEASTQLGSDVDLMVDAGLSGGVESTVVDLSVDPPVQLRAGAVPGAAIEDALGVRLIEP